MTQTTEWRRVPSLPKYEVTADGDVRNWNSKQVLQETQNKTTGAWHYSMRRDDGRTTTRNFWSLIYEAWPELKPEKVVQPKKPRKNRNKPPAKKPEYWKDVAGAPLYQISKDGQLRYKSNGQFLTVVDGQVTLRTVHSVESLVALTFGES